MMDWHSYWNNQRNITSANLLEQVGKTVCGVPVGDDQIGIIVGSITGALDIGPNDQVVDLCCGNGLLTGKIATRCKFITGVDYSEILIKVARQTNSASNIKFINKSILESLRSDINGQVFKFYMYEALQHFNVRDLARIFNTIAEISDGQARVFLASIPDRSRRFRFYNTFSRRMDYAWRSMLGKESIGTWWSKERLSGICHDLGYRCEIQAQNAELYTSHYRFNALIDMNHV